MENKIKKLIEKHIRNHESMRVLYGESSTYAINEEHIIDDLQCLLKLYQSQQEVAPESNPEVL